MFSEALARFLEPVIRTLVRVAMEEWRRPAVGEMVGGGEEVADDVRSAIDEAIDRR